MPTGLGFLGFGTDPNGAIGGAVSLLNALAGAMLNQQRTVDDQSSLFSNPDSVMLSSAVSVVCRLFLVSRFSFCIASRGNFLSQRNTKILHPSRTKRISIALIPFTNSRDADHALYEGPYSERGMGRK